MDTIIDRTHVSSNDRLTKDEIEEMRSELEERYGTRDFREAFRRMCVKNHWKAQQ